METSGALFLLGTLVAVVLLILSVVAPLVSRLKGFKVRWSFWNALGSFPAVALGAWVLVWLYYPWERSRGDYWAPNFLKAIASAQADFRTNDRDGNGIHDFWRKDIAGLYGLKGANGEPLALCAVGVAGADDRPVVHLAEEIKREPHGGYYYRALRCPGENDSALRRFAACCYPAQYNQNDFYSRYTYIINEYNMLYRKDLGGQKGVDS